MKQILTEEQIRTKVKELAVDISRDYEGRFPYSSGC